MSLPLCSDQYLFSFERVYRDWLHVLPSTHMIDFAGEVGRERPVSESGFTNCLALCSYPWHLEGRMVLRQLGQKARLE